MRTVYSMNVKKTFLYPLKVRTVRFKWENVIVLEITPGPKEPSLTFNIYLKYHVDELLSLLNGVVLIENAGPASIR